ncbi:MAG: peroxiredoxin family protein [Bacteroidia bacterium]|nr:peroxiredoxin family protein [Bacteroidia bacterium]MDW8235679.1 peroxiredoxin family protein [Bacteroidia bacterium]
MRKLLQFPLGTYVGLSLQIIALGATLLDSPYAAYTIWGAGVGILLIAVDFARFTGPLQYAAAYIGYPLLILSLPHPWGHKLYYGVPAGILLAMTLTLRQQYMYVLTYIRYLWLEAVLLGIALGLLVKMQFLSGIVPWSAFLAAIPGAVLALGYSQDGVLIRKAVRSGKPSSLKVGDVAPDFALPDAEGQIHRLSDYRGRNPVLLLFVRGDWCPACHMTLRVYGRYKDKFTEKGVVILTISPDPPSVHKDMIERLHASIQVLSDKDHHVSNLYGSLYQNPLLQKTIAGYDTGITIPTAYLIDKEGIIRYISNPEYVGEYLDPTTILPALEKV